MENGAHSSQARYLKQEGDKGLWWAGRNPPTRNPNYHQSPLPASAVAASDAFPFLARLEVTPSTLPSTLGDSLLTMSSEDEQPKAGGHGWDGVAARMGRMAGMG